MRHTPKEIEIQKYIDERDRKGLDKAPLTQEIFTWLTCITIGTAALVAVIFITSLFN